MTAANGKVTPPIAMIVAALLPELGIGIKGKMPWRLRQEIKYFKNVTTTTKDPNGINAVIMGRKTWESIPTKFRPLPGRLNIVLSRSYVSHGSNDEDIILTNSIENALAKIEEYGKPVEKIFVIGGSELYNKLISHEKVQHLLITEIKSTRPVEVDTWLKFPIYTESSDWTKQTNEDLGKFTGIDNEDVEITEGDFTYKYTYWKKKA